MVYIRKIHKLPSRIRILSWLGQTVEITKESEPEILSELGATQTAVVALCPEGTFDKGRFSNRRMISVFDESVVAILQDSNLPSSSVSATNLPWHSEASSYQRISAVLHTDGRLVPLKVVKGKYHPMQNAELLSDAKYLEGLSGGATEIVSGITSRDKAVFAVNLLYEDAVVSIDGQERRFGQAATLYTSHDSSLAYAIAFSVAPEGSEYPTHWLAIKHRNTKGMSTFRDKLKFDLVNLENKASQCVKEIELLGSIPLGAGTDDIQRLAEFVADATKPGGDKPYWDTWAPARLIKAYEATAQIYGHNALSFYLAANEWVLSRKANKKNFIAVLDLSENAFKVQSQLKQLLFSMYKGK